MGTGHSAAHVMMLLNILLSLQLEAWAGFVGRHMLQASPGTLVPVPSTKTFPYNCIGQLRVWDGTPINGTSELSIRSRDLCTATLISKDILLTAAHCLYNPAVPGDKGVPWEVNTIDFVAGFNRRPQPGERYAQQDQPELAAAVWYPPEFAECPLGPPRPDATQARYTDCHKKLDYGLVRLSEPFEVYMEIQYEEESRPNLPLSLAGYPADQSIACRDSYTTGWSNCTMYAATCVSTVLGDKGLGAQTKPNVDYPCFSTAGLSGGPVWTYNTADQSRRLRGINVAANPSGGGTPINPGTFLAITQEIFFQLHALFASI